MPKPKHVLHIEDSVRKKLSSTCGKEFFQDRKNRTLLVKNRPHTFDLVSKDKEIIDEIKSSTITTEQAYVTTKAKRVLVDCYLMDKVEAKKKILVLTDEDFWRKFRDGYEKVIEPIEIVPMLLSDL